MTLFKGGLWMGKSAEKQAKAIWQEGKNEKHNGPRLCFFDVYTINIIFLYVCLIIPK